MGSRDDEEDDPAELQDAIDAALKALADDPQDDGARSTLYRLAVRKLNSRGQPRGTSRELLLAGLRRELESKLRIAGNDLAEKTDLCQRYLIEDPLNSRVTTLLAKHLLERGYVSSAAFLAERAAKDDPSNREAAEFWLECMTRLGRNDVADAIRGRIQSIWRVPGKTKNAEEPPGPSASL